MQLFFKVNNWEILFKVMSVGPQNEVYLSFFSQTLWLLFISLFLPHPPFSIPGNIAVGPQIIHPSNKKKKSKEKSNSMKLGQNISENDWEKFIYFVYILRID